MSTDISTLKSLVKSEFSQRFSIAEPAMFFSPGRVNLIGEHTDYNNGFVLPAAIDRGVVLAIAPNTSQNINLYSVDLQDSYQLDLKPYLESNTAYRLQPDPRQSWTHYPLGVVDQLLQAGHVITGFDCVYSSNLPSGAGLSSSAAIECGIAYALRQLFDLPLTAPELARLAQQSENVFVGVQCGIMDQFASLMGRAEHVFKLDCRDLSYHYLPLSMVEHELILFNTQVKHNLADSEYNDRRRECEQGLARINELLKTSYDSLREVSLESLQACQKAMDVIVYKRCDYVVREITRVLAAETALNNQALDQFGQLMFATHEGLQHDYEVSCKELDFLVEQAQQHGVLGARMMGGGFGGCTINLVKKANTQTIVDGIAKAYQQTFQRDLPVYIVRASQGTHALNEYQPD